MQYPTLPFKYLEVKEDIDNITLSNPCADPGKFVWGGEPGSTDRRNLPLTKNFSLVFNVFYSFYLFV